jgi:hypothetical protein
MGFITNQWLKGERGRNRTYEPVKVRVWAESENDWWSRDHGVIYGFVQLARMETTRYSCLPQTT